MCAVDEGAGGKVGDGTGDFEQTVVAAHGELHFFGGAIEQLIDGGFGAEVLLEGLSAE